VLDRQCALVKDGGLLRSLQFAAEARQRGLPLIVGAHVGETSLLTRAALALVSAFRDDVVAHEGAFGTRLLERDMVEPSLMFGRNGILDATAKAIGRAPGLGLPGALLPVALYRAQAAGNRPAADAAPVL
jgi:hypothetical protein